jgi:ribosomal protein L11 methylase PrmA
LILSGLLAEQEQEVADALAKHGLCLVSRHITEDWVALVATTPEAS